MSDFNLDEFLPYQLAVLATRVSRGFSTLYHQKFDISIAEWRVVAHLSQAGTVSVREIHNRVDMDKSKVSRAASRLEKNGYVTKTGNPDDRRLVALALTQQGQDMVRELAPVAKTYEQSILAELENEAPQFRVALKRLLDAKRL